MILPTTLYKEAKKWVSTSSDKHSEIYNYLYFNGEKMYATDGHKMVIIKNYPAAEAHYETTDGVKTEVNVAEPLNYERIIPSDETISWRHTIKLSFSDCKMFLDDWKQTLTFFKTLIKKTPNKACHLKKENGKLYAYAVNERVKAKVLLLERLEGEDWDFPLKQTNLSCIVDFLRTTEPEEIEIKINKNRTVIAFETEELLMLSAPLNTSYIKNEWDYKTLTDFVATEPVLPPEKPKEIEVPEDEETEETTNEDETPATELESADEENPADENDDDIDFLG